MERAPLGAVVAGQPDRTVRFDADPTRCVDQGRRTARQAVGQERPVVSRTPLHHVGSSSLMIGDCCQEGCRQVGRRTVTAAWPVRSHSRHAGNGASAPYPRSVHDPSSPGPVLHGRPVTGGTGAARSSWWWHLIRCWRRAPDDGPDEGPGGMAGRAGWRTGRVGGPDPRRCRRGVMCGRATGGRSQRGWLQPDLAPVVGGTLVAERHRVAVLVAAASDAAHQGPEPRSTIDAVDCPATMPLRLCR